MNNTSPRNNKRRPSSREHGGKKKGWEVKETSERTSAEVKRDGDKRWQDME